MVKSPIRVCVRTRPTANFAKESITIDPEKKTINIHVGRSEESGFVNNQQEDWNFRYDGILHNASQEKVYDDIGREVVNSVLEGYNGTILAYGQTGAGKTFTMVGGTENYKYRGVIPRAIAQIFADVQNRPESAFTIRISFLEIYNETLVDLLAGLPSSDQTEQQLLIAEDSKGMVVVKGLKQVVATSEEEALNLFFEGETNRAIAQHSLNKSSTRSHCIFTVHVENRSRVESNEKIIVSKLNLVDLAGSERLKKTNSEGVILKEAMYINKSLTFLEQVIVALSDKKRDHVPFRQSKLTNVLKDSLGGNCKTYMIANIWAEGQHLDETISTLKFASRMMRISTDASINVEHDPVMLVKKYEREIKELKQELAMHDTLANRSHVSYEPYSEEQRYELNRQVRQYVHGELDELEVVNLRHIREIFMQFRSIVRSVQSELDDRARDNVAHASDRKTGKDSVMDTTKPSTAEDIGVGDIDGPGFGIAAKGKFGAAETLTLPDIKARGAGAIRKDTQPEPEARVPSAPTTHRSAGAKQAIPDRNTAFEQFKRDSGNVINQDLVANKATLKDKKKLLKDMSMKVNDCKHEIDTIKDFLQHKKLERESNPDYQNEEAEVIDEEEFSQIKRLRELKKEYKDAYELLQTTRSEVDYVSRLTEQCRQRLVSEFETWYDSFFGMRPGASPTSDDVSYWLR
eukprot:TRINITY_DN1474_c0_g1_i4.p1 TRINITY_DN1474_c0_g1~~TRINITY_DN1474_c0_g1_i4.p1  ORF type:complete len:689 (-),score=135.14 TRINITY_DN1474_c0_g1_i4:497-2563(-)